MDRYKLNEEKPWFVEWFDENYRMLYRHRNSEDAKEQLELILKVLTPDKSGKILDLCCGEGRYTALFQKLGYNIYGLDLSDTLIGIGKEKNPQLNLMVGDMRCIPGKYRLILSLFTSFGYFDTDSENQEALCSVFQALEPGGIYWLDFLNADYVAENLVPETHSQLSQGIEVVEKRKIEDGRIIKDIHFRGINASNGSKIYRESVRLFTRHSLEQMFNQVGFRIIHCFGDYHGKPWSPGTERTILVGKKGD